jgi:DNA-binding transcriptional ArsR family regulator
MDAVAGALADEIRRDVLMMLRERAQNAGDIARAFEVSRPAVSRHLRVLRDAGLVSDEVHGRERVYRLQVAALAPLQAFLLHLQTLDAQLWSERFDALATEVHRVKRTNKTRKQTTHNKQHHKRRQA